MITRTVRAVAGTMAVLGALVFGGRSGGTAALGTSTSGSF